MTTCFLAPDPIQSTQFIPGGNTPANGGQLFFYVAGSNTKQTVYKDNAANVAWTNPIVLDSGGNLPSGGEVWFPTGQTFKVVFAPSNDTDPPASPYWSKDNLSGMNDVSVTAQSEWVAGPTPTFVSATSFTLAGDQRTTFTVGRRLKTTNTGGTIYSTIVVSSFAASITTITVVNDSGTLDSGLSSVFYGILEPSNSSIDYYHVQKKATAVASAGNGTTDIWGVNGDYVHITGTNNIFSFSTAGYAGAERTVVFDGSLVLTYGASTIITPTASSISTAANDTAIIRADTTSKMMVVSYTRASGDAVLLHSSTKFTTSGTFIAPPGVTTVFLSGAGAGGGAGNATLNNSAGSGGGSGAVAIKVAATVVPGTSYSVTIGPGGGPGTPGNQGSSTIFGALLTLAGGSGGTSTVTFLTTGGGGGAGGQNGQSAGVSNVASGIIFGGRGGGTPWGDGGPGAVHINGSGTAGQTGANGVNGSGGGGGTAGAGTGGTGGTGGSGILIVEY